MFFSFPVSDSAEELKCTHENEFPAFSHRVCYGVGVGGGGMFSTLQRCNINLTLFNEKQLVDFIEADFLGLIVTRCFINLRSFHATQISQEFLFYNNICNLRFSDLNVKESNIQHTTCS